jgi:hypothetical protein
LVHEIKHDGYRLIARKQEGTVRALFTRRRFAGPSAIRASARPVAALTLPKTHRT